MIAFAIFLQTCIARVISRGGHARLGKSSPFRLPSSYLAFDVESSLNTAHKTKSAPRYRIRDREIKICRFLRTRL